MIITRSPLRISLGGGGTDLSSYYSEHEGFFISAAVDKYVYITLHETFEQEIIVKYSQHERVQRVAEIRHPIVRNALELLNIQKPNIEITSMADIPAGTGLGSSGSFTTALLKTLHSYRKNIILPEELAEQACRIEIDILKEPIGKQDQYIASYGGITCFTISKEGKVKADPLNISEEILFDLEDNLLLFFTGYSRSASSILRDQDDKSKTKDEDMIQNLHYIKELGIKSKEALEKGDLYEFAKLMDLHWQHKKFRSGGMTNPEINHFYELAMGNGAIGGKLIGAGGGGFLMFYTEDKVRLRHVLREAGLKEVRFRFDFEGTKVIVS